MTWYHTDLWSVPPKNHPQTAGRQYTTVNQESATPCARAHNFFLSFSLYLWKKGGKINWACEPVSMSMMLEARVSWSSCTRTPHCCTIVWAFQEFSEWMKTPTLSPSLYRINPLYVLCDALGTAECIGRIKSYFINWPFWKFFITTVHACNFGQTIIFRNFQKTVFKWIFR